MERASPLTLVVALLAASAAHAGVPAAPATGAAVEPATPPQAGESARGVAAATRGPGASPQPATDVATSPPPGAALTLEDALRIALDHRPDLAAGRARVEARRRAADAAADVFVPRLTTRVFGNQSRTPIAGPFDSFFQRDDTLSTQGAGFGLAVGGALPTGTSWEIGADGSVNAYTFYAEALNPRWEPGLHLKLTQHLWRSLDPAVNLAPLAVADADASVEESAAAAQEQAAALDVATAWLQASRAQSLVALRQKSVHLAAQFETLTRQLIDGGSLSRLDLALALQVVSARKADLAAAEADADLAQSRLGEALGRAPQGDAPSITTAPLADATAPPPALVVVVQKAKATSPALLAARATKQRVAAELPARTDRWKPDVRLVVDGSVSGVAGTTTCKAGFLRDGITPCHVPDAYVGGADRALTNLETGQLYSVGVGLEGDMPVFWGPSLAAADSGVADLRAADADLTAAEQHVEWEARRLLHDVEQRTALVASTSENLKLAADALAAEDTKLRSGRSTGFALITAQERAVEAEVQQTEARYQLAEARVRLEVLMGRLTAPPAAASGGT